MALPNVEKKALLLELGEIYIPRELQMPCFASRSTAGPDAGSSSHAFGFGRFRAKLTVSNDPASRLHLVQTGTGFGMRLDGEEFIGDVSILPLIAHSPNQAFMNLAAECRLGCAFCAMPKPSGKPDDTITPERVLKIVAINYRHPSFEGIALTSGIPDSVAETNARMMEMVRTLRARYPKVPIGVEAYVEDLADITGFRDAGATEMKLNIETWPESSFERICPNRDFGRTLAALEEAVRVFGRGRVTSNLIVGLGESDDEIISGLGTVARIGAIPNLRGIRVGPGNLGKLEKALGKAPERVPAERMLRLGREHRRILEENGLDTSSMKTMCFSCRCCDIVPMADL